MGNVSKLFYKLAIVGLEKGRLANSHIKFKIVENTNLHILWV